MPITPDGPNVVVRASLTEQLEEALRRDILAGHFAPGERLRSPELAKRYGVSATPLREALQRLAGYGLVELDAGIGARVASVSLGDLHDVYAARLVIEPAALERSIALGGADWQSGLRRAMQALEAASRGRGGPPSDHLTSVRAPAWATVHGDFHAALLAACDSQWLRTFAGTLADHADRYRVLGRDLSSVAARDSLLEHRAIFEAAVRGDALDGAERLRDHLGRTVLAFEQHFVGADERVP